MGTKTKRAREKINKVLLQYFPSTEALTLEGIAEKIMAAKKEIPDPIPEINSVYAKDGNLVFDVSGMLFQVDGSAAIELSRHRIPEA